MSTRISHVSLVIVIFTCFSLIVLAGTTAQAGKLVMKVSHQFALGDVRDQMARAFGDRVEKNSNGEIKFRYYPCKALFKPKEQWDAMKKGALDMSVFPLDYASGKVPQFSITLMPCAVQNIDQGLSWSKKPIGKKIEGLLEKNGVRSLAWAWFDGGIGSKVKQIKLPEDVAGTKLRAAGKKFEFMMREAGASVTSMPSSETYHALATGVLNTMLTSSASFVSYRLYEVLEYINIPRDYSIWHMANNLCIAEKSWERLNADQQKIFQEAATWLQEEWLPVNLKKSTDILIDEYQKAGIKIHYMTEAEFQTWLAFAKKTAWKDFSENVEGGEELLKLAVDAMK